MAIAVAFGLFPISAAFAEANQDNNTASVISPSDEVGEGINATTTTGAAVTINDGTNVQAPVIGEPIKTVNFNNEYDSAKETLDNFQASNSTKEQDVIDAVKDSIDSSINVSFGIDEGQVFKKVDATTEATGCITGTLILKNKLGDSKDIKVNINILKIENTLPLEQPIVQEPTELATDVTTTAAVIVKTEEVTKLDVSINGDAVTGKTVSVNVVGYNANNEKVELDKSKLTYKWFANELGDNTSLVGIDETLIVNDDLNEKFITCEVGYDEQEEGGIK